MKKKIMSIWFIIILILSFCVPVIAAETESNTPEINCIVDMAGLLRYEERNELEQYAKELSEKYGCGIYAVTLQDYRYYGTGDVYDVTTQIYHNKENGFGAGSGRDGIILLLSMQERDWAMFVYGEKAAYVFNRYGQEQLEKVFLDDFGNNDWYDGFSDYLNACEEYLAQAEEGKPMQKSPTPYILCSVGVSVLLAFMICMLLKRKMNTVYKKAEAGTYTVGSVHLTESYDRFTHITQTRRKIETSNSLKGSMSHKGGGGSGRSGHF